MDQRTLRIILPIWVVVANALGVAFVIVGPPPLPIIGVLLIIVGLMSLMLAMQAYLGELDFDFVD